MEVRFIGQGFNLEKNSSVAQELITALNNKSYNTFKCLVAFATRAGVNRLTPHILNSKEYIKDYRIVVGIDGGVTTKEALEALLEWEVEVYIYNFKPDGVIFHPKIYLFEGEDIGITIVGSNNLTYTGLVSNVESSILLEYNPKEEKGINFLTDINDYFHPILNGSHPNLKLLTQDLIDKLKRGNKIPNEEEVSEEYKSKKRKSTPNSDKKELDKLFPKVKIQKAPKDFEISQKTVLRGESSIIPAIFGSQIDLPREWDYNSSSVVLVAEFGKGTRWKQVNFPMAIFTEFFGANIGDNTYHINLRHIEKDTTIGEIESRQAVSVLSKNYRFEIGAATGKIYPKNNSTRPLGIFIKINTNNFVYKLIMPEENYYTQVRNFLYKNYSGANRELRRIITSYGVLLENCKNIPL